MAYPFPSHTTSSHHSHSPYLGVPPSVPRSRSNSRHSHHRSHSHRDHTVYPPNVVYTHGDHRYYPSSPSHHSTHHHRSHSSHHLPAYHPPAHSTHSTHSHRARSRSQSHSHSYVPAYQYHRERAPSISDRIRNFFGMEPDHYSHRHHQSHQSHYYPNDRRSRHNSFSSFRDASRPRRSSSVRTGPWFFGSVANQRYLDEHGREVDHRGRVIHRM